MRDDKITQIERKRIKEGEIISVPWLEGLKKKRTQDIEITNLPNKKFQAYISSMYQDISTENLI